MPKKASTMHLSSLRKPLDKVLHPVDYPNRQAKLEAKYESRRIKIDRPRPLPRSRINISQTNLQSRGQSTNRCPSLLKLPVELRLYIYRLAFGDNILHLYHFPRAIRHTRFSPNKTLKPAYAFADEFTQPVFQPPAFNGCYKNNLSTTGLALLLTCRQIYQEGVDLLYSSNVFSLNDLNILIFWSDLPLLPRQRLTVIRSLKISWTYYQDPAKNLGLKQAPYDWVTWQRFWGIIAHEMRLRSLDASIEYVGDAGANEGPVVEQAWFDPMMAVAGIERVRAEISVRSEINGQAKRLNDVERLIEKKWSAEKW